MGDKDSDVDGNAQGDSLDARGLPWRSKIPSIPKVVLHKAIESEDYYMEHTERGKCVIFNNKKFDPHTNLNERRGTDCDASSLYTCFRGLDFDTQQYNDYGAREILSTLKKVSKEDHTHRDSFVCCILTHGDQGVLYGRDGKFPTEDIFEPFRGNNCLSLAGKPKIFFIQACQGDRLDAGVKIMLEKPDSAPVCKIPTHADFLIMYSTVSGFYSWRNTQQGSWFIQSLCRAIKEHVKGMDLLQIMTIVNRIVAYDFESCCPDDEGMHMMKQVPCVTSTLTRKVYFPPKL